MTHPRNGFTLIEMLVVMALIAVLAGLAFPSLQGKLVREQIVEAMRIAEIAKAPVAVQWTLTKTLPADNAAAGLPAAERIVGNHVSAVTLKDGAIDVTFGNAVSGAIKGKILSLRPAVVEDAPIVPVAWVCGNAPVPTHMKARGENRTSVPNAFLPLGCVARKN